MVTRLRVAAVQMGLHGGEEATVQEAEKGVRDAARAGARFVCMPEHALLSRVVEPENSVYEKFAKLAKELGVYVNLGGIYEREKVVTRLVSPTISPDGDIISRQAKVHLYGGEKRKAEAGERFELFKADGVSVGVLVCHDAVFPESARTLTLMGAEILFVPSLIISTGIEPWHIYLMARSLENRVPIVSPNAYSPPRVPGKSIIVDLKYDRETSVMKLRPTVARDGRRVINAYIDLDEKRPLRKERLRERRTEAYAT